ESASFAPAAFSTTTVEGLLPGACEDQTVVRVFIGVTTLLVFVLVATALVDGQAREARDARATRDARDARRQNRESRATRPSSETPEEASAGDASQPREEIPTTVPATAPVPVLSAEQAIREI